MFLSAIIFLSHYEDFKFKLKSFQDIEFLFWDKVSIFST